MACPRLSLADGLNSDVRHAQIFFSDPLPHTKVSPVTITLGPILVALLLAQAPAARPLAGEVVDNHGKAVTVPGS